jgi:hypothetical protein
VQPDVNKINKGPSKAIKCPISHWHIRIQRKLEGSDLIEQGLLTPSIPYYIPIVMVPVITCIVVCCFLKKLSFGNCAVCKKDTWSERMQNARNIEWIHRNSSFAFVPMQSWDASNEEIRIEELADMLQNTPVLNAIEFQRQGTRQLTGPCDSNSKTSDTEILNKNVASSNLYDNVVQELQESF